MMFHPDLIGSRPFYKAKCIQYKLKVPFILTVPRPFRSPKSLLRFKANSYLWVPVKLVIQCYTSIYMEQSNYFPGMWALARKDWTKPKPEHNRANTKPCSSMSSLQSLWWHHLSSGRLRQPLLCGPAVGSTCVLFTQWL